MKGNPYIGPRPYERQDAHNFYGRAREARDLVSLILANRVVLFYAQSGAGKTSLLNTQVIPALEEHGFNILPVARVGRDVPPGIDPKCVKNVFIFSALMGLAGKDIAPQALTQHTLLLFLRQSLNLLQVSEAAEAPELDGDETITAVGVRRPPILIMDQFEEILTTHRDRWQDAQGFFEQLQEALRKMPELGLVLAMREDHIAGLDPYAPLLPKRLRARYRMEQLTIEGALEAVQKPALRAGAPVAPGVAERLVDDLRRIKTLPSLSAPSAETPSGAGERVIALGPYIEPVQLQVVCNRLWDKLPEDIGEYIDWEEIKRYGDIDRALTEFYESGVAQATQRTSTPEQQIRRWFGEQMITPNQTRGLAMRGETGTAGLPNGAVDVLEDRHIIRADERAGGRVYELAHDRLIDPILQSNREWEAARQTPLRTTAKRWQETKSESLLYRDKALKEANAWVKANPNEAEPYEVEFLGACQKVEQARRRTRNLTIAGVVGAVLIALAMAFLAITANQAKQTAEEQRKIALARQLAAQSQMVLDNSGAGLVKSVLLAVESMRRHSTLEGDQALRQGLSLLPRRAGQVEHHDEVYAVAFSPSGRLMASASRHGAVRVWNLETGNQASQMEHGGDTIAIAFSPDGQTVTSWGTDGTMRTWQVVTGKELAHAQHEGGAETVAFSPDGQWTAWASWDGTIRVEATATGQQVARVTHGQDAVMALAFSPDGRWLASSGRDGTARVWETASGREVSRVGHGGWVYIVAFSPDGRWVASGSDDGTVRVWEAATGREVAQMSHKGPVYALTFSPNGQWVASGSWDGTAQVWKAATGQPVAQMLHEGAVYAVAFSSNSQQVASASWDGTARVWETTSGRELVRMVHESPVRTVAFSLDGRWVASGDRGGTAQVWEAASGQQVVRLELGESVNTAALSPDAGQIASGSWDGTVVVWQAATGQEVMRKTYNGAIWDVAFSPDGQWIASAHEWPDSTARVWRLSTGQEIASQPKHTGSVNAVAFGPNGQWAVSGDDQGTVLVWEAMTGQEIARMTHTGAVNAVAASPDGQWVASGSNDGTLRVWAATTGREIVSMTHESPVLAVAFSPNSQWIASGGKDGTARVWKATTGQEAARIRHLGPVQDVAFSPDGQWVVSGSKDSTARVWKADTGQEVARMKHDWVVRSVAFSPDGQWVVSGSWDGTARLWLWRPEDMIAEACTRLSRNLTREEWRLYLYSEPYHLTCPDLPAPRQ